MTASVKVKTHSWPVRIETTDSYEGKEPMRSEETVQPNSERTVCLAQNRSLTFSQLPLPPRE